MAQPSRSLTAWLTSISGEIRGPSVVAAGPAAVHPEGVAETRLVASGVYVGGTEGLIHGARYIIAHRGEILQVLGPVEVDPTAVLLEQDLASLDVSAVGDRLVISRAGGRASLFALVFQNLSGASGEQLERVLRRSHPDPAVL